jgi:hypothetical protein
MQSAMDSMGSIGEAKEVWLARLQGLTIVQPGTSSTSGNAIDSIPDEFMGACFEGKIFFTKQPVGHGSCH